MQSKTFFSQIAYTFALAVCVVLAAFFLYMAFPKSKIESTAFSASSSAFYAQKTELSPIPKGSVGAPVRLKIPSIKVDARFEYVNLTSKGLIGAPKSSAKVGWFSRSSRPGDSGSAIVDGHSGYRDDRQGAFDNLGKIRKGDKVYVLDDKGATIAFVVREIKIYDRNESAEDIFGSEDGKSHLNLITCT